MDQYEVIMMKHGEHGVQAILENWERFSGIRHPAFLPLHERWNVFLQETNALLRPVAA